MDDKQAADKAEKGAQWLKEHLLDRYEQGMGLRRAYLLVDREGEIRRVHPGVTGILGHSKEELNGLRYRALISSETFEQHLCGLAYAVDRAVQESDTAAASRLNYGLIAIRKRFLPLNAVSYISREIAKFEHEHETEKTLSGETDDGLELRLRHRENGSRQVESVTLYKYPTEYGNEYAGALLLLKQPEGLFRKAKHKLAAWLDDKQMTLTNEYVLPIHTLGDKQLVGQYGLAINRRSREEMVAVDLTLTTTLDQDALGGLFEVFKGHIAQEKLIFGHAHKDIRSYLAKLMDLAKMKQNLLRFNQLVYPAANEPVVDGPGTTRELTTAVELERFCISGIQTLEQKNPDAHAIPGPSVPPVQTNP